MAADQLIVSGTVRADGTKTSIDQARFVANGRWVATDPDGVFELQARDAAGAVLQAVRFNASFPFPEDSDAPSDTGYFVVGIRWVEGIRQLVLLRDGRIVADLPASARPPEVSWIWPKAGATFTNSTIRLEWDGRDPDGDVLSYKVEFSDDGGASWRLLGLELKDPMLDVEPDQLAGTTNGFLRVTANDGLLHGAGVVGPVTIPPKAPRVMLRDVPDGPEVSGYGLVFLRAEAWDLKDGAVKDLVWQSDRSGVLGEGEVISVRPEDLPEGTHHIKVSARNSAGLESSASFEFRSWVEAIPLLSAGAVGDGVMVSWESMKTTFVLQSAAAVEGPWADVASAPSVRGHRSEVAVPPVETERFFRLRR